MSNQCIRESGIGNRESEIGNRGIDIEPPRQALLSRRVLHSLPFLSAENQTHPPPRQGPDQVPNSRCVYPRKEKGTKGNGPLPLARRVECAGWPGRYLPCFFSFFFFFFWIDKLITRLLGTEPYLCGNETRESGSGERKERGRGRFLILSDLIGTS